MGRAPGSARRYDYLLVGGGLQSGLIALSALRRRPGATVAIVEKAPRLGGNHTWCYHEDDLPPALAPAVEPLVAARWPGYEVRFPAYRRRVGIPYAAVRSSQLHEVVAGALAEAPGSELVAGVRATRLSAQSAELESGEILRGDLVVDARGPPPTPAADSKAFSGFQSFCGLELSLDRPHGLARPILMDATVPQIGGFRFFYGLPFSPTRILLEDTYFADDPALDRERVRARVLERARELGFGAARVEREEAGVLPMPWRGGLPREPGPGEALAAGYRGGFFHPATGYSFPAAARVADFLTSRDPATARLEIGSAVARHRRQARFGQVLNRLAFGWFPPDCRFRPFERFYRLPEATIRRFYALELKAGDAVRIFGGKPPRGLSLRRALAGAGAARGPERKR